MGRVDNAELNLIRHGIRRFTDPGLFTPGEQLFVSLFLCGVVAVKVLRLRLKPRGRVRSRLKLLQFALGFGQPPFVRSDRHLGFNQAHLDLFVHRIPDLGLAAAARLAISFTPAAFGGSLHCRYLAAQRNHVRVSLGEPQ